jgi:hypothetical protein
MSGSSSHADLSLATVIHSLSCSFSLLFKPSFLRGTYVSKRVVWSAEELPTEGLAVCTTPCQAFLGDLDSFIALWIRCSCNECTRYIVTYS